MPPSRRTTVKRLPDLARYDATSVAEVLDAGLVAHVGIVSDGHPVVLPMAYARVDDHLVLHGSVASRLQRALAGGAPLCVTVTVLDGLRIARSAFNMSMGYRSVVVMGTAQVLTDATDRERALRAILDHLLPGHWDHVRAPSPVELRQTSVLTVPLTEASVKVSSGPRDDDPEDLLGSAWGGELPFALVAGPVVPDPRLQPGIHPPRSVTGRVGEEPWRGRR